jgi:GNAT superfamily N-acetyltransferase
MNFEIVPAHEISISQQANVFNEAFAGYVAGSFQMNASSLALFMCGHGIDLCHSRFVRDGKGALVSFGFINRTGNITRLAGMGTVPSARRTGAGRFLVSNLLQEAEARGDGTMVLEVIEQNPPAVALYRACGFTEVSRLFGWRIDAKAGRSPATELHEIFLTEALGVAAPLDYPELPWQISRHAVAKVGSARAFRAGDAIIIIGTPNASPVRIYAFPRCDGTNWESFRSLTTAVLARFPNHEFFAPAVYPEQFGSEIFEPLKFRKEPLRQFLMRRDL